jgi:putative lipoprotein
MRSVKGEIVLPADAPEREAKTVLIEVRDVSVADAPSQVVATTRLANIECRPNERIPFELPTPEAPASRMLAVRVHVDWDGDGSVSSGDLLTTESIPVPVAGFVGALRVPVRLI